MRKLSCTTTNIKIGENIRRARISAGLTQRSVAEKYGISLTNYQKYENGERVASWPKISRLCGVLDTTPNVLLDYDTAPNALTDLTSSLDANDLEPSLKLITNLAVINGYDLSLKHGAVEGQANRERLFWRYMASAFVDVMQMISGGSSSDEAVKYLMGIGRGLELRHHQESNLGALLSDNQSASLNLR